MSELEFAKEGRKSKGGAPRGVLVSAFLVRDHVDSECLEGAEQTRQWWMVTGAADVDARVRGEVRAGR